jgi:hypothetical protein
MLTVATLESRTAAVALDWSFAVDPWLAARESSIRAAGDSLASRLTRPGVDVWPITVTTGPQPGALADAYPVWRQDEFSPSSGVIRFDTGRPWDSTYDLEHTVWHELSHAVGVLDHSDDPAGLMYPFAPYVREAMPVLQSSDVSLFEQAGWSVALPPAPPTPPPSADGWVPFPGFAGTVTLASADLTGDGVPDLVAAAGAGGGPHVKVRDGASGSELASFFAFDPAFRGGVNIAVGDVTGDGTPDVVAAAGAGGGPHVKAFDGRSMAEVRSFFAHDVAFAGGVNVAVSGGRIVTAAGGVVREW